MILTKIVLMCSKCYRILGIGSDGTVLELPNFVGRVNLRERARVHGWDSKSGIDLCTECAVDDLLKDAKDL